MKIDLDENKINAIANLMKVGGAGVEALTELFQKAEAELDSVKNIDPKGNMGLQALAAQRALDTVVEIRSYIFPDSVRVERVNGEEKKISQWR